MPSPAINLYRADRFGLSRLVTIVREFGKRFQSLVLLIVALVRRSKPTLKSIQQLVDVHSPEAERIVLVMDHLNTHGPASLYKAFPPEKARRLFECLEIHCTSKHGSGLKMTDIEFSVLSKQCLDRRIPDQVTLKSEIQAWEERRNVTASAMEWHFTTADARIKLKHLYPTLKD